MEPSIAMENPMDRGIIPKPPVKARGKRGLYGGWVG